jgi:hypothetical protein
MIRWVWTSECKLQTPQTPQTSLWKLLVTNL